MALTESGPIDGEVAKEADGKTGREPIPPLSATPRGIGGWLIFPAIGIVISPMVSLASVPELVEILNQLPSGTLIHGFVWAEVIVNTALAVFAVKVAFDFFRLKRQAPSNYIAFMVATVVALAADLFLAVQFLGVEFLPEDARSITRALIASVIWIPYFIRSKRVANTFVR